MSFSSIFNIAGSALDAQSIRLNVTASNLANANTIAPSEEQAYRARHPIFATVLNETQNAIGRGVQVEEIIESGAPIRREYNPNHPLSNEEGYVFMPNVNAIEEMANMISASRSFQQNLEVINTAKQLMLRTLSLGQ